MSHPAYRQDGFFFLACRRYVLNSCPESCFLKRRLTGSIAKFDDWGTVIGPAPSITIKDGGRHEEELGTRLKVEFAIERQTLTPAITKQLARLDDAERAMRGTAESSQTNGKETTVSLPILKQAVKAVWEMERSYTASASAPRISDTRGIILQQRENT